MKCNKCEKDFPENELEESHDVPCYFFEGPTRKIRKKTADLYGRHHLCKKCHDIYEKTIFSYIFSSLPRHIRLNAIRTASKFAEKYFKKENDTKTITKE